MNFIIFFLIYWLFGFQNTIGITTLMNFYNHPNTTELLLGTSLYLFGTLSTMWHLFVILCYQCAINSDTIVSRLKYIREMYDINMKVYTQFKQNETSEMSEKVKDIHIKYEKYIDMYIYKTNLIYQKYVNLLEYYNNIYQYMNQINEQYQIMMKFNSIINYMNETIKYYLNVAKDKLYMSDNIKKYVDNAMMIYNDVQIIKVPEDLPEINNHTDLRELMKKLPKGLPITGELPPIFNLQNLPPIPNLQDLPQMQNLFQNSNFKMTNEDLMNMSNMNMSNMKPPSNDELKNMMTMFTDLDKMSKEMESFGATLNNLPIPQQNEKKVKKNKHKNKKI